MLPSELAWFGSLVGWLIYWLFGCSVGWFVGCVFDSLVACLHALNTRNTTKPRLTTPFGKVSGFQLTLAWLELARLVCFSLLAWFALLGLLALLFLACLLSLACLLHLACLLCLAYLIYLAC